MSTHTDLSPYLEQLGLVVRQVTGAEIICLCPNHDDTKGKFSFNQDQMVGHCWVCDFRVASLDHLALHLTGQHADGDIVTDAVALSLERAVRVLRPGRAKVEYNHDKVLAWRYSQLRPVPAQLLAFRHLSAEHAAWFDVRFDPSLRCWTLPIHSPQGHLMGWQRRQKGGFDNYPKGVVKSESLFGLHRYDERRLVLVESPLDAVRLHQCGIPAVSSYGAEVSERQMELLARNTATVVLALDNDGPGRRAAAWVSSKLKQRVAVVPWRYGDDSVKDPGEYRTDEEIMTAWRRTLRHGL